MDESQHNGIMSVIWGIADGILALEAEADGLLRQIVADTEVAA